MILSDAETKVLEECTNTSVVCLNLSSEEAKELLSCIDNGIRMLIAYTHTQEINPLDVFWYNQKCQTLLDIKIRLSKFVTQQPTGHE